MENKDYRWPNSLEITARRAAITLKPFTANDAREIFELIDRNREHLSQHGDTTAEKYQTEQDVLDSIVNPKNPERLRLAIRNQSNQIIGSINLTPDKAIKTRAEIGYYLGKEYTGHGRMTEAVVALVSYAYFNRGITYFFGDVHKDNIASARTLINVGFEVSRKGKGENDIRYVFDFRQKPS